MWNNRRGRMGPVSKVPWDARSPDPHLQMQRCPGPRLCWPGKAEGAQLLTGHTRAGWGGLGERVGCRPRQMSICAERPRLSLEKPVSEIDSKSSRSSAHIPFRCHRSHLWLPGWRLGAHSFTHWKLLPNAKEWGIRPWTTLNLMPK